ncbi:MAG: metallophosphoesterase [Candidatus Sericytochromatia bacterium]|nr:metallophosphoesterase [Candidatus Sericytochromatia bacterium]
MHGYLFLRVSSMHGMPSEATCALGGVLALLWMTTVAGFVLERLLPPALARPLAWVGHTWQGTSFILLCCLLLTEPFRFLPEVLAASGVALNLSASAPSDLNGWLSLVAVTAGVVLAGVALFDAIRGPRVVHVTVPIPNLPPEWHGLRIAQISDVHVGNTVRNRYVRRLSKSIRNLQPDLLAITGDLVDGPVYRLSEQLAPLLEWKPPLGIAFAPGNHEYYAGAEEWLEFLQSHGVQVLRNGHVQHERGGAALVVAGVDDFAAPRFGGPGPDLAAALKGAPAEAPVILLAHQPPAIGAARDAGVALQLSGHTHGGQIVPFNLLVRLDQPHVAGLFRHGGTWLYVSRGTGWWGPPMRLGAPAELTLLECVSA